MTDQSRTARILRRLLVPVLAVGTLALVNDAVYGHLEGQRYCLDEQLAAQSPGLTDTFCVSLGIDGGPLPERFRDVVVDGAATVWDPASAEARRLWALLG